MADYNYSLTIPEANISEMIEVFGQGYETEIEVDGDMVSNPQSKALFAAEFLDKLIKATIHQRVKQYRQKQVPAIDDTKITG